MKMTTGILGCALAAGLMTFAADKAQASGIVIGNSFYEPISLKVVVNYADNSNDKTKFKKASITSKTVLKKLGYKNATLAYLEGDVYVIDTKTKEVLTDLTEDGIMTADFTSLLSSETSQSNGAYKYVESGVLNLKLDSNGNLNTNVLTVADSSFNGFYSFDITGPYALKYSESKLDKNNDYNVKISVKSELTGTGIDTDLSGEDTLPVAGSYKESGSGKLSDD